MHQTRKGNQWHFGVNSRIGADSDSKPVHTVVVTAAKVSDIAKTAELMHGQETQHHADDGYTGVEKYEEITTLDRRGDWQIGIKRGKLKPMEEGAAKETRKTTEKVKASVRACVEHPFHIVENPFGYCKVRYRGLAKNGPQLHIVFSLYSSANTRRLMRARTDECGLNKRDFSVLEGLNKSWLAR